MFPMFSAILDLTLLGYVLNISHSSLGRQIAFDHIAFEDWNCLSYTKRPSIINAIAIVIEISRGRS